MDSTPIVQSVFEREREGVGRGTRRGWSGVRDVKNFKSRKGGLVRVNLASGSAEQCLSY